MTPPPPCPPGACCVTAVAVFYRGQEMPWTLKGGSKCALFDYSCAAKEKAAKAALAD